MGNPGGDEPLQKEVKNSYLATLKTRAKEEGKKVVLFFDELHEALKSFAQEFLPHLSSWCGLVVKTFVASATFNDATVEALCKVAELTQKRVRILEAGPTKQQTQARLYLHVTNESYSEKNLAALAGLRAVIDGRSSKTVNILTGSKGLAEALTHPSKANTYHESDNDEVVQAVLSLKPVLVTADTSNAFQEGRNHVGTTFKTGVDITNPESILVIVLPCIPKQSSDLEGYGIFSEGASALLQAVGRLRNGGEVHVFMNDPGIYLKGCNPFSTQLSQTYRAFNEGYDLLRTVVDTHARRTVDGVTAEKGVFTYKFLVESQKYLTGRQLSYGKRLSPYVLWAALNDQFPNATLQGITYYEPCTKDVLLDDDKLLAGLTGAKLLAGLTKESIDELKALLALTELLQEEAFYEPVKGMRLTQAFHYVRNSLKFSVDNTGNGQKRVSRNVFLWKGKKLSFNGFRKTAALNKAALRLSEYFRVGDSSEITYYGYVRRFIADELPNADSYRLGIPLFRAYREFQALGSEFVGLFRFHVRERGKDPVTLRYLTSVYEKPDFVSLAKKVLPTLLMLKELDEVLRDTFDVFQNVPTSFPNDELGQGKVTNTIVGVLEKCFLDFGKREKVKGINFNVATGYTTEGVTKAFEPELSKVDLARAVRELLVQDARKQHPIGVG